MGHRRGGSTSAREASEGRVLVVADLLQPLAIPAVQRFRDGDVSHGRGRLGAMPVLLARRRPDDVTGPDLLDGPAPALHPAAAGGDDQRLTQWMGMPCRAGARLEG